MASTSVTGHGVGVASGQKGSQHMSLGVSKLVGPKIACAGTCVLSGTTGVVLIPDQGTLTDYIVILQSRTATAAYVSSALAQSSGSWTFTITGSSGATVDYLVVKIGL